MEYAMIDTPEGSFGFVARDGRLVATYLPAEMERIRKRIRRQWPDARESRNLMPAFRRKVEKYFSGERIAFDETIDLAGIPPFRRLVLEQCRRIPWGRTASYQDLARAAGNPRAARAVGSAMAHNPIPLVIPCHRVLRADGSIGGFSSPRGISEKKRMLRLEGTSAR